MYMIISDRLNVCHVLVEFLKTLVFSCGLKKHMQFFDVDVFVSPSISCAMYCNQLTELSF